MNFNELNIKKDTLFINVSLKTEKKNVSKQGNFLNCTYLLLCIGTQNYLYYILFLN